MTSATAQTSSPDALDEAGSDADLLPAGSRVFVAGHRGLVGSAVKRKLTAEGYHVIGFTRTELDLKDAAATRSALEDVKPDAIVLAAAKVGGIMANSQFPVEFLEENLRIQMSVINGAFKTGVERLLFLGSSCIYPKLAAQPIREDSMLTGSLEPTNQAYAIAKIAGILQIQAYRSEYGASYISAMPTNLYGPGDNFDLNSSHVLPAMIRKFDQAHRAGSGRVTLWGTGRPLREFLHVDDLAAACLTLLRTYDRPEPVNIGTGEDLSIFELAQLVGRVVGFQGDIVFDSSKPDGTPRKLLDVSKLRALGFAPSIDLEDGIRSTYQWWLAQRG